MSGYAGPWEVDERVAWVRHGEHVLVLLLAAPYDALPWRLAEPAASLWEGVASGCDGAVLAAASGADTPDRVEQIGAFVEELTSAGLIRPRRRPRSG